MLKRHVNVFLMMADLMTWVLQNVVLHSFFKFKPWCWKHNSYVYLRKGTLSLLSTDSVFSEIWKQTFYVFFWKMSPLLSYSNIQFRKPHDQELLRLSWVSKLHLVELPLYVVYDVISHDPCFFSWIKHMCWFIRNVAFQHIIHLGVSKCFNQ